MQEPEHPTYHQFIVPQLTQLLLAFTKAHSAFSVLEVEPGPKSILSQLPLQLRRAISTYDGFEPNTLFAQSCTDWLLTDSAPLPLLVTPPQVQNIASRLRKDRKYELVLFCHSLYGMDFKSGAIK